MHTVEYFSLRKSLLSRIYVKVKEYAIITKSVYNIYKESHTLHGMILFGFLYIFLRIPLTLKTSLLSP